MIWKTLLTLLRNSRERHHLQRKQVAIHWLTTQRRERRFNRLLRGKGIFYSAWLLLLSVFMCLRLRTVTQQLKNFFFLMYCFQVFFFVPPNSETAYQETSTFLHLWGARGGCHLLMQGSLINPSKNKVKKICTPVSQPLAVMPEITMFKTAMSDEDYLLPKLSNTGYFI